MAKWKGPGVAKKGDIELKEGDNIPKDFFDTKRFEQLYDKGRIETGSKSRPVDNKGGE